MDMHGSTLVYIYIYISEVRGSEFALVAAPPNREIDFDFDFDSFVRAGEAKLCGCVRDMPPHRWGCDCQKLLLVLRRVRSGFCCYMCGC